MAEEHDALHALAAEMGIALSYMGQMGEERRASSETLRGLLAAMDLPVESEAAAADALADLRARREARPVPEWLVVDADRPADLALPSEWRVRTESGEEIGGAGSGLPALPAGYHALQVGDVSALVMAVPPRPPLPERTWGVTLPLYGLRTEEQGGIGDYDDLRRATIALGRHGANFVGMNPVHAGFLEDPEANSPYSPSHRRRLNVLHVAVPGESPPDTPLIDYPRARQDKLGALERAFEAFRETGGDPAFAAWIEESGPSLWRFATHQALSETFGAYWTEWPAAYQNPGSPEVRAFAEENDERVTLHAFLQWKAETQLRDVARAADEAGMAHGLYLDLAVGTHPAGAETWGDRAAFATGASLGAPPDEFSAEGQNWGLAPLNPRALIAAHFTPLIETLRVQLRFARLLRIDHILGFDRAFWVPQGAPGTYVKMPKEAMLAVVRIEAARAGATVVGEDLGNIPEGLQDDLAAAGLLGCRVMMFERGPDGGVRPPAEWDASALASFGTHDLPTYAGWRKGHEIDWRRKLGHIERGAAHRAHDERRHDVSALEQAVGGADVDAMHAQLGRTASALVALQIEDILGLEEQPNLPGTVSEHPNWRRRLPVSPDELADDPRLVRAARVMSESGR